VRACVRVCMCVRSAYAYALYRIIYVFP